VLEEEGVAGIAVDEEGCAGEVLGGGVGDQGGGHDVAHAGGVQDGLGDARQVCLDPVEREGCAFHDRGDLAGPGRLGHLGAAVRDPGGDPGEVVVPGGAPRVGIGEEQVHQLLRAGVGLGHDGPHPVVGRRRPGDLAAGVAGGQDEPTDEVGPLQRDVLGDGAAERPAEEVDPGEAEGLDELDGAVSEPLDRVTRGARTVARSDVVEHDHVVVGGEPVQERGVPPVEGGPDPVQQDQRDAAAQADPPVGERPGRSVHGQVLGHVGQRNGGHGEPPFSLAGGVTRWTISVS
jgi:hypothetical protein